MLTCSLQGIITDEFEVIITLNKCRIPVAMGNTGGSPCHISRAFSYTCSYFCSVWMGNDFIIVIIIINMS